MCMLAKPSPKIDKFHLDKGTAHKTIDLRRMLERKLLDCGENIHCGKINMNRQIFLYGCKKF